MEEKKKSKLPLLLNILLILSVGFLAFKISELTKKKSPVQTRIIFFSKRE